MNEGLWFDATLAISQSYRLSTNTVWSNVFFSNFSAVETVTYNGVKKDMTDVIWICLLWN